MLTDSTTFALGKNRFEALSDGIFAIAMTLLVLELHLPNLPPNAPNVQVAPALWQLWPKVLTYAVSFLSLGVYWIGHHGIVSKPVQKLVGRLTLFQGISQVLSHRKTT